MKLVSLCPNFVWKLVHKWSMHCVSEEKKKHILSYYLLKDQQFNRKFTLDIPKLKFQNGLKQKTSNFMVFWDKQVGKGLTHQEVQIFFADSEFSEQCRHFGTWVGRWSKWNGGVTSCSQISHTNVVTTEKPSHIEWSKHSHGNCQSSYTSKLWNLKFYRKVWKLWQNQICDLTA